MAEFVGTEAVQTVDPNQAVLLDTSIPCPRGNVIHRDGSGILTLRGSGGGCNSFARYQVTFNGNIAIPEGGTVAAIATAIAINGEPLQSSRAVVTPAAVGTYFNVTNTSFVTVPACCCYTVSVENTSASVGDETVEQQAISVANPNLVVTRVA